MHRLQFIARKILNRPLIGWGHRCQMFVSIEFKPISVHIAFGHTKNHNSTAEHVQFTNL